MRQDRGEGGKQLRGALADPAASGPRRRLVPCPCSWGASLWLWAGGGPTWGPAVKARPRRGGPRGAQLPGRVGTAPAQHSGQRAGHWGSVLRQQGRVAAQLCCAKQMGGTRIKCTDAAAATAKGNARAISAPTHTHAARHVRGGWPRPCPRVAAAVCARKRRAAPANRGWGRRRERRGSGAAGTKARYSCLAGCSR